MATKALPIAEAVLHQFRHRMLDLTEALDHCRQEPSEPAVHDLRLAVRHVEPALSVLEAVEPGNEDLGRLRKRLRRMLEFTSALRDAQQRRLQLPGTVPHHPLLKVLLEHTDRDERSAQGKVREHLDRPALERLVRRSLRTMRTITDVTAEKALRKVVEHGRERMQRRIGKLKADDPRSLHRARVAVKRQRYVLVSFASHLSPMEVVRRRTLQRYQERLGRWHDERLLADWLMDRPKDMARKLRATCAPIAEDRSKWCIMEQRRLVHALRRSRT